MKLTKYDSYKDSGVEWLGEIPNHWEVKRVKDICEVNKETLSENGILDKEITYVDIGSVDANYGITNVENMYFSEAPSRARRIVRNGDIIISTVRTYLKAIAYIDKNLAGFIVSTGFATLTPNNGLISKYLYYSAFSNYFIERIMAYSVGVSYPAIDSSFVRCNFVLITRKEEQIRIANFLDKKTSQIDKKINLLQEKKESYEELKKSLINEIVCRGINKNVELKDSGVGWIGKIPKHWKLVRLKDVSKNIFAGGTPSTRIESYWNKKEIIWLPSGELQNNIIYKHSKNKYISFKGLTNSATKMIKPNTTLIALTGATCANVGYLTFQACANQSVVAITNSTEFVSKYLFYYLLSKRNYIETYKTGGAQAGINTNDVKYIIFPKSPEEEQIQIANYLDDKTSKINKIISKINAQIETLKEFRKTLINDVVTGKVRIQDE